MNTSKILKELRLEADLTQSELAKYLQIGQSTIVGYEKGEREATLTNLCRYANYFSVSLDFLAGRENDYGAKVTAPMHDSYSSEERKLVEQYRQLNTSGKHLIDETLKTLLTTTSAVKSEPKKKYS